MIGNYCMRTGRTGGCSSRSNLLNISGMGLFSAVINTLPITYLAVTWQ